MKRNQANMEELLKRSLPSASREQAEAAGSRVWIRLRSSSSNTLAETAVDFGRNRNFGWRWAVSAAVAASVGILAIWLGIGSQNSRVFAEPVEGLLYRATAGNTDHVRAGERIEAGENIRTNEYASATFKLPDGSRVEMRSKTELSLESAKDGVRIRLKKGAVVVDSAGQSWGSRVYVQTDTVTASALASGFLVNVEDPGTRVASLWGVIRVEQGDRVTTLQPAEQTATAASMKKVSISDAIGWSRNASTYIAQLKKAADISAGSSPQSETPAVKQSESSVSSLTPRLSQNIHAEEQNRSGGRGSQPADAELDTLISSLGYENEKQTPPPARTDPWAEGKRILDRSCSSCHTTNFVLRQILDGRAQQRYASRSEYEALVAAENTRGAGVSGSETAPLVDWLSNFAGFR